ncbi:hypothetical protein KUCAC02_016951 [Chaenocephalus aceratus]|nr:hypothetical protein KUCAC02_016951 [Chaenocephalus aceratus]
MPVTSCFVISVPHPAEEKDSHLTLMLTPALASLLPVTQRYRSPEAHTRKEEKKMEKIGVARGGRDVAAVVSLLLEQSSHLVVARRTVAASMREQ